MEKMFHDDREILLAEVRVLRVSSKIDVQARSADELTRRLRHTGGSRIHPDLAWMPAFAA